MTDERYIAAYNDRQLAAGPPDVDDEPCPQCDGEGCGACDHTGLASHYEDPDDEPIDYDLF